jgi:GxxExxY protein
MEFTTERGLRIERQKSFPLLYRSLTLDHAYRVDLLVQESVIVEIKAIEQLVPIHYAQLLSYLRLARLPSPRPPSSSASSAFKGSAS